MDEHTHEGAQHSPNEGTHHESKHEPKHDVVMGALAYIGPLVIVAYLMAKDDPFVKFHIKQGLLLFVGEVAIWMLGMMFWPLWFLLQIVNIFLLVLAVVGIIRASRGEMKELPFIGHLAHNFKL
jgi:uncharacterized membrane protein